MTTPTVTQRVEDLADKVGNDIGGMRNLITGLNADVLARQRLAWLRTRLSPAGSASTGGGEVSTTPTTSTDTSALVVSNPNRGMSATDGRLLSKYEHIRQSLSDIFRTSIGSRVLRREYGSRLPDLVDNPLNDSTVLAIVTAAAEAALRWEDRITVFFVQIQEVSSEGRLVLGIGAEDEDGNAISIGEVYA